ncbi:hypothetical protein [Flavobacterium sp.]|uniref:hypothetical protein n=1 Tax=Flavobacterium sp. TaxID=239 RepID=UPI0026294EC7|nr:hypothetical protein [Flavobacterium sp.]
MAEIEDGILENYEEIINWTYPGATLYYKDCDLEPSVAEKFTKDLLIRNGYFLDVSCLGGGIKFNTRFLIASAKAARLYEINPDNERFGHCAININSYFKILDVYKLNGKTQIFLLHIPAKSLRYFERASSNWDEDFIQKARQSFDTRIHQEPRPDLLEPFWLERTNYPVGMDAYDKFYPLTSVTPIPKAGEPLYNGIKKLTNDTSEINIPAPYYSELNGKSKIGVFLNKIFGK